MQGISVHFYRTARFDPESHTKCGDRKHLRTYILDLWKGKSIKGLQGRREEAFLNTTRTQARLHTSALTNLLKHYTLP
jgi:hypothetical protein